MMVLTKSEIVKLLNIKDENLSTLINTLEQLSKDEGISRVAFVDDIVSGRIDAQVLEVINVEGKSIAILDYFGDKTTIDEVIEGLECEDPLLYRYVLPLPRQITRSLPSNQLWYREWNSRVRTTCRIRWWTLLILGTCKRFACNLKQKELYSSSFFIIILYSIPSIVCNFIISS